MFGFGSPPRGWPTKEPYFNRRVGAAYAYWRYRCIWNECDVFNLRDYSYPYFKEFNKNIEVILKDAAGNSLMASATVITTGDEGYPGTEEFMYYMFFPFKVVPKSYDVEVSHVRTNMVLEFSPDNIYWFEAHKYYIKPELDAGYYNNTLNRTFEIV